MKILNIIQCTNLGGMEQASLRLMNALINQGDSCELISLNPLGEMGPLLKISNIPAIGIKYEGRGGWKSFFMQRKIIRQHIKDKDALLMTGHNFIAMQSMGDVAKGRRVLAMHFHHKGVKPTWQWRLIYELARRKFNAITFPSDFIRHEAIEICPAIANISWTVRNPLPIQAIPSADEKILAKKTLGIPTNCKVIGNAGWLIKRKRFDIFLMVAQKVLEQEKNIVFVIAGDGVERAALSDLAISLGIEKRIFWLGWQGDLSNFYKSLDVLLFNSDWDAFPTTPMEAMSWGVPVVASNINGGLDEVINSSKYGFLFKDHDVQCMKSAINKILSDGDQNIGLYGHQRIMEMCNPKSIAITMKSILKGESHD